MAPLPIPFLGFLESIGTTELLAILVVALIVFGPRKLPELARGLGRGMTEFKRASEDFQRTWEHAADGERAAGISPTAATLPGRDEAEQHPAATDAAPVGVAAEAASLPA
ncbi:MAG TPA: twin-arginine translocase TatA/TatE family subunit [Pyrinomonadaceae bacterium]